MENGPGAPSAEAPATVIPKSWDEAIKSGALTAAASSAYAVYRLPRYWDKGMDERSKNALQQLQKQRPESARDRWGSNGGYVMRPPTAKKEPRRVRRKRAGGEW